MFQADINAQLFKKIKEWPSPSPSQPTALLYDYCQFFRRDPTSDIPILIFLSRPQSSDLWDRGWWGGINNQAAACRVLFRQSSPMQFLIPFKTAEESR